MKTTEEIREFLKELDSNLNYISISDFIYSDNEIEAIDQNNAFDSIKKKLEDDGAFNVEIIYSSEAIKYLAENDPSLRESLEIANIFSYESKNLNSKLLASLLASQNERSLFYKLESAIEEFFNN
jgi:hypothetical protein